MRENAFVFVMYKKQFSTYTWTLFLLEKCYKAIRDAWYIVHISHSFSCTLYIVPVCYFSAHYKCNGVECLLLFWRIWTNSTDMNVKCFLLGIPMENLTRQQTTTAVRTLYSQFLTKEICTCHHDQYQSIRNYFEWKMLQATEKPLGWKLLLIHVSFTFPFGLKSNNRLKVMDLLCRIWYKKSKTNRFIAWMCVLCVCGIQFEALIARNSFSKKKKTWIIWTWSQFGSSTESTLNLLLFNAAECKPINNLNSLHSLIIRRLVEMTLFLSRIRNEKHIALRQPRFSTTAAT